MNWNDILKLGAADSLWTWLRARWIVVVETLDKLTWPWHDSGGWHTHSGETVLRWHGFLNGTGCGLGLWFGVSDLSFWSCTYGLASFSITQQFMIVSRPGGQSTVFGVWKSLHKLCWSWMSLESRIQRLSNPSCNGMFFTTGVLGHWTCYFADGFADQVCLSDALWQVASEGVLVMTWF